MNSSDQARLRSLILDAVNNIVRIEGGPVFVSEVRLVPGRNFFGLSYGTSILTENGDIAIRIAVGRPPAEVVDTILHETAHVLLGPEHIDQPDHGPRFQELYGHLTQKYSSSVTSSLG